MSKMTIRIILKSGAEFSIKCDEFTIEKNQFEVFTGYNIKGITENKPVYLDLEQIAAIVRVYSDEVIEAAPKKRREVDFTETRTKCPFCKGANENARVYEDKQNKEFFVYCPVCGIETTDTYTSKHKALSAFAEGKNSRLIGQEQDK